MVLRQTSTRGAARKAAPMRAKHLTTSETSSAQILKQPQKKKKKKCVPRHTIKARPRSRRRPGKSPAQPKLGTGRKLKARKRTAYTQSQDTRLKKCCCIYSASLAKCSLESGLRSAAPKAPKQLNRGWANGSGLKAGKRNPSGKRAGKAETFPPSLAEKPKLLSSTREIHRMLNPTTAGKSHYQAVSEYQFIYPGKSTSHHNRETVKQELREIYLSNQQIKQNRTSLCPPNGHQAPRRKLRLNARCPIGCEFLRSMRTNLTPYGLSSLTCKINNLVLVGEKPQVAPPKDLPFLQYLPQLQYPFEQLNGQLPFSKSFSRELPHNVSFLAEERQPGPPLAALEVSKEKVAGCFMSYPCEGNEEADVWNPTGPKFFWSGHLEASS